MAAISTSSAIGLTALLVVAAGGGLAVAAETAVPGDPLYPIKTEVNETVRSSFAFTTAGEAEVEVDLALNRLEELYELAEEDRLNGSVSATLEENFRTRASAAMQLAAQASDREEANEILIEFHEDLQEQQAAFADLQANATVEVAGIISAIETHMQAIASATADVDGATDADVDGDADATTVKIEAELTATQEVVQSVQAALNTAADVSAEVQANVEQNLSAATTAINNARLELQQEAYQNARILSQSAADFAADARATLEGVIDGDLDADADLDIDTQVDTSATVEQDQNTNANSNVRVNGSANAEVRVNGETVDSESDVESTTDGSMELNY